MKICVASLFSFWLELYLLFFIFRLEPKPHRNISHTHRMNFFFCEFLIVPIYLLNFILILPSNFSHIRCGHCCVVWILIFRRAHMWVLLHVYMIRKKNKKKNKPPTGWFGGRQIITYGKYVCEYKYMNIIWDIYRRDIHRHRNEIEADYRRRN